MNYIPLHVHSHYSLMDGVATPEEYVKRAQSNEMKAIAITDHGGLSGHRAMYRAAKAGGIKPILGIEAYITKDRFDKRDREERTTPLDLIYNHIILLAKNNKGLENLNKLNELAWTEGFYSKPRIDFEILEKYKEGIVVLSGCISGLVANAIKEKEYASAKSYLSWFKENFQDDFYVEVMPHNSPEINKELLSMADSMDIKSVVTPDCHHATPDQKVIQEMMLILNTHAKIQKDTKFEKSAKINNMMERLDYLYGDRSLSFKDYDIHLLSFEEMKSAMESQGISRDDIYANSIEIADKVEEYNIESGLDLLPTKIDDPHMGLVDLVLKGMKEKGLYDKTEYKERMQEELDIIKEKNFSSYFLIVSNMLNWAKEQGILVGPGRGSAAGSLVCYVLGITDIDPIKHGLLFFRFINPERNDFPDIDSDIADNRRDEVKAYLEKEYNNVASIATFLEFKGKGVVRDVSRALNVPLSDVNKVLKYVDDWDDFCRSKNSQWFRMKYPEVVTYGEQLRGRIRGTGIHAAGVVTAKEPIFKYAPMETRIAPGTKERIPVVAVDMDEAANIGLIKLDVLGLKTLTVIDDTLKTIKQRHKKDIVLKDINLDDKNVYNLLSEGKTKGVFQCEATPYTNLLVKMGVSNLDELAASNALVRPGAMNTIGKDYLLRKHGKKITEYIHPIMQEFTKETYGCVLYQEQVMQACVYLGGMTMAEADKVRKIIGKKKDAKEFDQFKDRFVVGASKHITQFQAEALWHDFEAHAGYSFNKSHAVAYSTLSYWTAWLKYYYPLEFMYCLLKNEQDKDARTEYLIEAKRMGISVKLPHVNESGVDFSIEGKGIRIGLSSIKWISANMAEKIISKRPYTSLKEFVTLASKKGSGINSRAIEALKVLGALTFVDNPRDDQKVKENLYEYLNLPEFTTSVPPHYYAYINDVEEYEEKGVFILMGVIKNIKRGKGWSRVEIMDSTGMTGIFDDEETKIEAGKTYIMAVADNRIMEAIPIDEVKNSNSNSLIKFLNYKSLPYGQDEHYVLSFKSRITKAGKKMASMIVADVNREMKSVLIFPKMFSEGFMKCEPGTAKKMSFSLMEDRTVTLKEVVNV
ncbi:MAG: DNA polymerase III subunit alpha [Sediminibacterium sp.]